MYISREPIHILIIEDNSADLYLLEHRLKTSHLNTGHIYAAERMVEAKATLQQNEIHLVLLDLSLPDSFGIDSLLDIKEFTQNIPVIILTGVNDSAIALEALKHNAQDYLVKGAYSTDLLVRSIEYSIERKKAQERIHASEEKYRQIFYKNPFPMVVSDQDTLEILEVNEAAVRNYGYSKTEFLGLKLTNICPQWTSGLSISQVMEAKLWLHQKKDLDQMIVEVAYYPVQFSGKAAIQFQFHDVTEKMKLERALSLQKQQLIKAVLDAQERERKSIGEELHDNINQVLTAIKLNLEMSLAHPAENQQLISRSVNNISSTIEEIRKLSRKFILSGNIKELGLVQSVQELIKEFQDSNIQFTVSAIDFTDDQLNQEQKINLYRIIQEQLNNIVKHAEATEVMILVSMNSYYLDLEIHDNGKGFNTSLNRKGVGLTNIINRAELLYGEADIVSEPGDGCQLKVKIPVSPKNLLETELNRKLDHYKISNTTL